LHAVLFQSLGSVHAAFTLPGESSLWKDSLLSLRAAMCLDFKN